MARRFSAYQTNGELFRKIEKNSLQLTMSEHIWRIIIEIVARLAEMLSLDPEELILELMSENYKLAKFIILITYGKRDRELAKLELLKYPTVR